MENTETTIPENKNTPREHDVNVLLEKEWSELERLMRNYDTNLRFVMLGFTLGLILMGSSSLILLTSTVVLFIYFVITGVLLISISLTGYLFNEKYSSEKAKEKFFQISVFLDSYSKVFKDIYYINEKNSKLLEKAKPHYVVDKTNFMDKAPKIYLGLLLFILIVIFYSSLYATFEQIKQMETLEQENKALKEKIKQLEKKEKK